MVKIETFFEFDNNEISHRISNIPNNEDVDVYEQGFFIQSELFSNNDSRLGVVTFSKLDRTGDSAFESEGVDGDIFLHFKNDPILLENELNKIKIPKENLERVKNVLLGRKMSIPYGYSLLSNSNNNIDNCLIVYSSIISTSGILNEATLLNQIVTIKIWLNNNKTIANLSFDII
jgi:hypothetical protein